MGLEKPLLCFPHVLTQQLIMLDTLPDNPFDATNTIYLTCDVIAVNKLAQLHNL